MRVTSLQLTNFRSIVDMAPIELGSINILIGPNNTGKSTLIRALSAIQGGNEPFAPDVRIGSQGAQIIIEFEDVRDIRPWAPINANNATCTISIGDGQVGLDFAYNNHPSGKQRTNVHPLPNEPDRFACFDQDQFEHYYPAEFSDRVEQVLSETNKPARREAKRILLDEVRAWLDADEDRARTALASSAASVITALKGIEERL